MGPNNARTAEWYTREIAEKARRLRRNRESTRHADGSSAIAPTLTRALAVGEGPRATGTSRLLILSWLSPRQISRSFRYRNSHRWPPGPVRATNA
jgi:hypothetical protein